MGAFHRDGTFADRATFLGELRSKLAHLRTNVLPGMTEVWEEENGVDHVRVNGFGVKVLFTVAVRDWFCDAVLPDWLPIPQRTIEQKFDEEFASLLNQTRGGNGCP
jgi:hypothetical protein